ncbi:hypothetical protein HY571_02665 [Candidatus Micrarchaeota archaeon]|nr:hypothetical protein [Candidatus Micrarchaeota archaeon]
MGDGEEPRVSVRSGYEFLLSHPVFLNALNVVKALKPVSIPFNLEVNGKKQLFHLRRTRRDHYAYHVRAFDTGVAFPEPILGLDDSETRRHYLVVSHSPVTPLVEFLLSQSPNKRKLGALRRIAQELSKLNAGGLQHGDVVHFNFYIGKGDSILVANPELDSEIVSHLQGDLEQFREMLFHLERELDHEPPGLWELVRNDPVLQKLTKS